MFLPHWNKIIKKVKGHKETFGGEELFITFIVVVVTFMYAYIQTHQIEYINYVQIFFLIISQKSQKKYP